MQAGEDGGEAAAMRWQRLEDLLVAALELPAEARDDFLRRECGDDAGLRSELQALVAAHDRTGVLDRPITGLGTPEAESAVPALAPGTVVAHYEIQARLGSGGMGVVYRARDLRLERIVALKFLPPALGTHEQAKRRFLVEARAAAALQHVNVCTIHEIGETAAGQLFIAMAFVDGESLAATLDRGPLPVAQAIGIARQLAAALQSAHQRGVVHRDVKPANVMLGADGVTRLVDFGVAKVAGSALTGTGLTPGTLAYMSPEQVRGQEVDHRTDLWSLGVVLYEMLAGQRPFTGESDAATLYAITAGTPPPLAALHPDIPVALERVVARALARERDQRFQSAGEMEEALRRIDADAEPRVRPRAPVSRRSVVLGVAAAALLIGAGVPAWRRAAVRRALDSLPRIEQLAERGRYVEAYALAAAAERVLAGDTTLRRLMPLVSDRIVVTSHPAGARVWLRRVGDDGALVADSAFAGETPLRGLRVARADYRVDIRKDGFAPLARVASSALNRAEASFGVAADVVLDVTLRERGGVPGGMVFVSGGTYTLVAREAPTADSVALPDYFIDEHEVTNAQFRDFVVAGGYADQRYWRHPFVLDGRPVSWAEAMRRLIDRTGLPGPRGWSGQEFPEGQAQLPVTGVTWYEAAAYAEFVGKRLPTIFEWEKAARDGRLTHFEHVVMPWGLADPTRGIARRANFGGRGAEAVDSHPSGISPWGAYNMAGNVEEWIANPRGEERFIAGGAWDDPMYVFANYLSLPGFHASGSLGFRCARTADGATGDPGGFEILPGAATVDYRPVNDATYRNLLHHYAYDRGPLDAEVVERTTTPDWTRETVRIAGPWRDATVVYVYLPVRGTRPLQTVVFVPGTNTFFEASLAAETERIMGAHVKAGRAVVAVLFKGMVGRAWDAGRVAPATSSVQYRQELVSHATELRRGLDYLETRPDLDLARLAYVGFSKGAGSWLPFAAVEPRFRSFVLIGGGLDEKYLPALPEVNTVNFASRIVGPKLLLNGRYDEENPWPRRGQPLWRLLREPRRLVLVEGGHLPPAEARVPAINAWLDETVGPVRRDRSP